MPSAAAPPEQPLLPLLPRASLPCITHGRFYLKQTCLPLPPVCCCRLEALETTSRDCEQLMPQAQVALAGRARQLAAELAGVEGDILEAEAKHELYKLLEIRTRWVGGWVGGWLAGWLAGWLLPRGC